MSDAVFHQGDLQSGIARAITESKLVICFVRDATNEQCRVWESEWIGCEDAADLDSSLGSVLSQKAVLLRIDTGTQEANFLNAFCPIEKTPMLAVIHNGQVLEKLESGITEDEFRARLLEVCGLDETESAAITPDSEDAHTGVSDTPTAATTRVPESDAGRSSTITQREGNNVQSLFSERAQRLEAERREREAAEKAERIARANTRREEAEKAATGGIDGTSQSNQKEQARDAWILQQKQRKDEAKKERERILKQIESDKKERRAQKEREKENREAGGTGASSSIPSKTSRSIPSANAKCALQVRLFDGSSIRSTFSADNTLAQAVRTWIKQASPEGGADIPYSFRQILAPQPSRSIEVSEEHRSLQDLDLFPNATLVLVPIEGYTSAYEGGNGGYLGTALNAAYWCAGTASSVLGTAISYIPGASMFSSGENTTTTEQNNPATPQSMTNESTARTDKAKVNTLFDGRSTQDPRNQPATFYNGNSSAFEGNRPNKSDEDDSR